MKKILIFSFLILGISGAVAQIIILREFLIVFHGNELTIGIIFAVWLIWEAFGAYGIGKKIETIKEKFEAFIYLTLLFSLFFPTTIYLIRTFKDIFRILPGEGLSVFQIFYFSFFILFPVCVCHGALFTFGAKVYSLLSKDSQNSNTETIKAIYIYETAGTAIGGIIITYFFIPFFHSIKSALYISIFNVIVCLMLFFYGLYKRSFSMKKNTGVLSTIFLVILGYILFSPAADKIEQLSIRKQWKNKEVIFYQNSIYNNWTVIKNGEQYTFYSDSMPVVFVPTPDLITVEEIVHLSMLGHSDPQKILVIGGGIGGAINEILKYPVNKVDYVEIDPLIFKIIKKFPTTLTEAELNDNRVNIINTDGRIFIRKTKDKYDVVIIKITLPKDLQTNRLFTREFYLEISKKIKEDGILVVNLPGTIGYMSEELKNFNACIFNTLNSIYSYIKIIPGENKNIFLASNSKNIKFIDPSSFVKKANKINLKTNVITESYIKYKLNPELEDWFLKNIKNTTEKINQDFLSSGLFYALLYYHSLFSSATVKFFKFFEKINFFLLFFLFSFFIVGLFIILGNVNKKNYYASVPYVIFSTGFAGIVLELILIFTFQVLYGYVFYWIGMLITAFMLGSIAGCFWASKNMHKDKEWNLLLKIEILLIIFILILPIILLILKYYFGKQLSPFLIHFIFFILCFLAAVPTGAEFPIANKIYYRSTSDLSGTVGLLYGTDLFGGVVGGLLGSIILFQIVGLIMTCVILALIKLSSIIILYLSYKKLNY